MKNSGRALLRTRTLLLQVVNVRILIICAALAASLAVPAARPALGQESAGEVAGEVADKPADEKALREQTVYIPYEKLRDVFEKRGRGVFLPYDEFMTLWRVARAAEARVDDAAPPVKAMITESDSTATVSGDVMNVAAEIKIEVLAEGWHEIGLGLAESAIRSASLEGKPARLLFDAQSGYRVLIEKKGKEPQLFTLSLEYAREISRAAGLNSVSFTSPGAPVSRWKVVIPESSAKVNITPAIATTELTSAVAGAEGDDTEGGEAAEAPKPKSTELLAFVGSAPQVSIRWTPKAEGATDLDALSSVQIYQQFIIDEGVTRTRARLVYSISRAEVGGLIIEAPAGQKVVSVVNANVRQWSVEESGGLQKIIVQLFEPVREQQIIDLELEHFASDGDDDSSEVVAPLIRAVGADRQQGYIAVSVASGLRSEAARRQGLLQIDPAELPAQLRGSWSYAYRYSALPYELALAVEKIEPRVTTDTFVAAHLQSDELTIDLLSVLTVEQAGIFRVEYDIPEGLELLQVQGVALPCGVAAAQVAGHTVEGQGGRRLVVNLSNRVLGRAALLIKLRRPLDDRRLHDTVGEQVDIKLPLPGIAPGTVQRDSGAVLVYVPESLKVSAGEFAGLRRTTAQKALEPIAGNNNWMGAYGSTLSPSLVFAYSDGEKNLSVQAERQKPYVSVRQLLLTKVESGAVSYEARFNYDIRYNSVKSLRLDVPAALDDAIRLTSSGITERRLTDAPDLPQGYVARVFTSDSEFKGSRWIILKWEAELSSLGVGRPVDFTVPEIRPHGVDQAMGQIVLVKSEQIDLRPTAALKNLRMIDPRHDLMSGASVADAARAFEFTESGWQLRLQATRYEPAEVKGTSIELALLRMVVTRSGAVSTQALYRMRSARQRLLIQLPEGVEFETLPMINGRQVKLERGDESGNRVLVPLVNQSPDEPFVLDLRYTVADAGTKLQVPHFPEEPAVQKVYLLAYLPQEEALLGSFGPWSSDVEATQALYRHDAHVEQLLQKLCANIPAAAAEAAAFQTDGRVYVFSALQPAAAADMQLTLATMHRNWLSGLVIAVILICGIILLRFPLKVKIMTAGLFLILLVMLMVFLPTFAQQVIGGAMAAAVIAVAVIWGVYVAIVEAPQWWRRHREFCSWRAVAVTPDEATALSSPPGAYEQASETASTEEPLPPTPPAPPETSEGGDSDTDNDQGGEKNA